MKTTLLFLSVFLSVTLFGQREIFTNDSKMISVLYFVGKTDSQLYFVESGSLQTFKIDLSRIQIAQSTLERIPLFEPINTLASSLLKFSTQSKTGIGISILSSFGSVIVPFLTTYTPALIISPAIGIIGFIVWASSYNHLKKGSQISLAIDYP